MDNEIEVLHKCLELLSRLDQPAQLRTLSWLSDRLSATETAAHEPERPLNTPNEGQSYPSGQPLRATTHLCGRFSSVQEILAHCQPRTDADRVLITTAWFQHNQPKQELTGRFINDSLRNMGKEVKNITSTLLLLEKRSPAQVFSSSNRKNSRKSYKVTEEGFRYVNNQFDHIT